VKEWTNSLHLEALDIDSVVIKEAQIELQGHIAKPSGKCPHCGKSSRSLHSHYYRRLSDIALSQRWVRLVVGIRRFRCRNQRCSHQTIAESLEGIAPAFARRTQRLTKALRQIGLLIGAAMGQRIAELVQMKTSPTTLLRIIRQTALPALTTPRVLGVDDWAERRGKVYGTILVDLETGRPIELLTDRSAETLAAWLRGHPGVDIISRDRSTEYMRGASEGAPDAQQVADRWHVLKNLREALERMLNRVRPELEQLPILTHNMQSTSSVIRPAFDSMKPSQQASKQASRRRRYECYQAVRQLAADGIPEVHIARRLGLARATVRKLARAEVFPERAVNRPRKSQLDAYVPYLQKRLGEGCTIATDLWREIQTQGYNGSRDQVARWLQYRRTTPAPTMPRRYLPTLVTALNLPRNHLLGNVLPASRQLVWLLLRSTDDLTEHEKLTFSRLRQHAHVEAAYQLTRQFQSMVRLRSADNFQAWLQACLVSNVSDLQTFATALQREESSIRLTLSSPFSNGPVEGHVNRLKFIKRSMYGRAKFDLLRLRVLAPYPYLHAK
jgi:transposase